MKLKGRLEIILRRLKTSNLYCGRLRHSECLPTKGGLGLITLDRSKTRETTALRVRTVLRLVEAKYNCQENQCDVEAGHFRLSSESKKCEDEKDGSEEAAFLFGAIHRSKVTQTPLCIDMDCVIYKHVGEPTHLSLSTAGKVGSHPTSSIGNRYKKKSLATWSSSTLLGGRTARNTYRSLPT